METRNPDYESAGGYRGILAVQVDVPERLVFLRKVYTLFTLAILTFAGTAWWAVSSSFAFDLLSRLPGGLVGVLLVMGGLFLLLRLCAASFPLNVVALFGFAAAEGILVAPLLSFAGPGTVAQATVLTGVTFGGLTLYTLTTRRDFSFLRAGLWTCFAILFGFGLLGLLFGWNLSWGYDLGWVLLMAGFLIYDTSNVMRRFPVDQPAAAAAAIFLDVVILFTHLLRLLGRRD